MPLGRILKEYNLPHKLHFFPPQMYYHSPAPPSPIYNQRACFIIIVTERKK